MSDLGPSKSSSGFDGSSNFTKSHNYAKYKKVTKSCPKTDHRAGGKIDLVTLSAVELEVWWRQLAQMCDFVDPSCENGAQRPSKSPKKSPGRKNTQKILPGRCPKKFSAQHGRARLREATKTQQNVITVRRAPRKHEKGAKQKHERKPLTTTNADVPLVIRPTRVRSKFAKIPSHPPRKH